MADSPPLVATYRLQLTPTFGLREATSLLPYLARLGISHVYTSSYLQAFPGSMHGYDTVDHARVSTDLGGEDAVTAFHAALRAHGLGNVVDVVPNHMSVAEASVNRHWWNVLRDGPDGPDAAWFDIDWTPPQGGLDGRILLAVLGEDYATELAAGSLTVVASDDASLSTAYEVHYGPMRFPIDPRTMPVSGSIPTGAGDVHELLERQHYRLASWQLGREEINYRRFFDVSTLIGVRVEDPAVFDAVHERTLEWLRSGDVQGLRIDHPDGLRDPERYLQELRRAAPDAWITVEKILEPGEALPATWPVDGTTGYDAMRRITGVFIDPAAEAAMANVFNRVVSHTDRPYKAYLRDSKRQVLDEMFGSELTRLTALAVQVCKPDPAARDFSRRQLEAAVVALLVSMPVYRTYVTARGPLTAEDAAVLDHAVTDAAEFDPATPPALFDHLRRVLRGEVDDDAAWEFVARFQQLSGPTMAKGVEDTTFYRFIPLLALNEVGSDPAIFGISVAEFHAEMLLAARTRPRSMTASSTHDTKRSEDVQARIALLSEATEEWRAAVSRWLDMNREKWAGTAPDPTMEYLLYQTLFGAGPLSSERLHGVLEKSMREAKQITSWTHPAAAEQSVFAFAEALQEDAVFQADMGAFRAEFDLAAHRSSLAQLTLKVMCPGVPDFYQGSELWTTSLVDPDNRAEVDYPTRIELLDEMGDLDTAPGLALDEAGASKMWLTRRLLDIRRTVPTAFAGSDATYRPLSLHGARAGDAIAFDRGGRVLVITPVRPVRLTRDGWGDTSITLPPGTWIDALGAARPMQGRQFEGATPIGDLTSVGDVAVLVLSDDHRDDQRDDRTDEGAVDVAISTDALLTTIRVWAPQADGVGLVTPDGTQSMTATEGGWFESADGLAPGAMYQFAIAEVVVPDPRSARQPNGPQSWSEVVDHTSFTWTDDGWTGFPLAAAVLYELHVGTFSPEGTFDGVIAKLDHLQDLGVTAIEIMPVATFPGTRGWGYDGVNLFAPHEFYGGPEGLRRLVDACHARQIAVVLDVVYNHLGPVGNSLHYFGPYFTDAYHSPWGDAVNLDGPGSDEVRRFIIDNALQWVLDYHVDGLRLDAVHALHDESVVHILDELGEELHAAGRRTARTVWVIAESDLNDPRLVRSNEAYGYGLDAAWSDDFHHALHVSLTGEQEGYYADFDGVDDLAEAINNVYVFGGRFAPSKERTHGKGVGDMDRSRFVCFTQNHDQIGNRATGLRLAQLLSPQRLEIAAALLLTAPFVPMLFQGEEWAASTPFQYFTDVDDEEVGIAVSEGRRAELAAFGWKPEDIPDPQDVATYDRSVLDWSERSGATHTRILDWHRRLIAMRSELPSLRDGRVAATVVRHEAGSSLIVMERGELTIVVNLGDVSPVTVRPGAVVLLANGDSHAIQSSDDDSTLLVQTDQIVILQH